MSSTSVVRSSGLLRSPKSIMKRASRPTPLPLSPSPFPFSTSFNIMLSVPARSSRVHFPPSPALFATFATHSPNSYDRGPHPVSPSSQLNALSLTSPSLPGFKLSEPPKGKRTKTSTEIQPQDPRSPRPVAMQSFAAAMSIGSKPRVKLNKALIVYPRSPYPSAPLSPEVSSDIETELSTQAQQQSQDLEPASRKSRVRASSAPSAGRSKRSTLKEKEPQGITFQLTSSRRLAPPHLDLSAAEMNPSLAPTEETTGASPVLAVATNQSEDDLGALSDASSRDSTRLSNAFWQSVTIEVEEDGASQSNGIIEFGGFPASGGASSDGGFPESVTGSQVSDSDDALLRGLMSPRPSRPGRGMMIPRTRMPPRQERLPTLTFGRNDGTVWSPGANESPSSSLSDEHDHLLSISQALAVPRRAFTAPTPNDPFAQFPSFAAALEAADMGSSTRNKKGMSLGSCLSASIVDSVRQPPQVHMP